MTKHLISNSLSRIGKHRAGMMASVAILALLGAGLATESFMTSAPANAAASTTKIAARTSKFRKASVACPMGFVQSISFGT